MKENSIEEDIKIANNFMTYFNKNIQNGYKADLTVLEEEIEAIEHILSDHKRILKENEMYKKNSEIMSKENLSTSEQLKVEIKENFRLKNQLENNLKEYQETYKDIREELKELKKENEELRQDRNNNYQMIALAQNEALGYMQGYEDGKKLKRSAVANIVENQQYYIIKKQIEKCETYIEQLRKELKQKDKIIDLMAETINNHDIDEDICKQMGEKANCNEFEDTEKCKECIKQYFNNKAKEIK